MCQDELIIGLRVDLDKFFILVQTTLNQSFYLSEEDDDIECMLQKYKKIFEGKHFIDFILG